MGILFENSGVIDPRAITTFGVNSKETARAIGFFGTGLKYAISIILREGCSITVYSGKNKLEFGKLQEKIRVDTFDLITMNGEPLGFTTEVGKTWDLWQAFRELYCNCIDEGGTVSEIPSGEKVEGEEGKTKIVVEGDLFRDVYQNRSEIILESKPLEIGEECDIHPGPSKYLYYRGVRAYDLQKPSIFTYNIKKTLNLTEDRTIKWHFEAEDAIAQSVASSKSDSIIKEILTAKDSSYEKGLSFSYTNPGEVFLEVVRSLSKSFSRRLNVSALEVCRHYFMNSLPEEETSIKLDRVDEARLKKAVDFCEKIGFQVRNHPIIVTDWLGEGVLGLAHNGKIYLSQRVFMMGTKMLAGTLIEEYIHLKHNLGDCERDMQNFLVDTVVSLGEKVLGEPL